MSKLAVALGILTVAVALAFAASPAHAQDGAERVSPSQSTSASAAVRPSSSPDSGRPTLQRRGWRYRILPGDVIEVSFLLTPEFDQVVTIQPDGYVTLKAVGSLVAGGRTTEEFTQALQAAYGKILRDPIITVNLNDFAKPYFIVDGQVDKPGKFELRGETTVTEAVAIAGGFKDTAKHSQVVLFRKVSDQWAEVKVLNVKHMMNSRNLAEDVYLRPGDMLFVPKNVISKIKPFIPVPSLGTYFNLGQYLP
jgi:polysaccharide export outer membrane protein